MCIWSMLEGCRPSPKSPLLASMPAGNLDVPMCKAIVWNHATTGVKVVMEAACIMFDEKPVMVPDPNKLGKKVGFLCLPGACLIAVNFLGLGYTPPYLLSKPAQSYSRSLLSSAFRVCSVPLSESVSDYFQFCSLSMLSEYAQSCPPSQHCQYHLPKKGGASPYTSPYN